MAVNSAERALATANTIMIAATPRLMVASSKASHPRSTVENERPRFRWLLRNLDILRHILARRYVDRLQHLGRRHALVPVDEVHVGARGHLKLERAVLAAHLGEGMVEHQHVRVH